MKFRKLTAVLLTMILFVSLLAINAFAAVNETLGAPVVSGTYDEATGDITLTWEPVEGAASYKIHGCLLEEIDWNLQDLGETSETSFVYTEGVPGNTYCFFVNAWDAEGNVSPENSNDVIVECTIPEPDPIAAPVVKASNDTETGKIKLNWNAVEGAVKYQVYRSTSKNGSYSLMFTTEGTSYTNSNAQVGTRYYYKVKAIAAEGGKNSEFSAIVSRTADLARPEVSITNVVSSGKIKLTWTAVKGAKEYKVYRSTAKNGSYSLMFTTKNTSYTNSNATAGQKYFYKVRAIHNNTDANSAYSAIKSRTADLAKTTGLKVENATAKAVKISWNKVAGAASYKVYRSETKNGTYKLVKTVTVRNCNDTTVAPGKTYYYKVKAICSNTDGNGALSGYVSAKTVPAAPVMKNTAKATTDTITVSWEKVPSASGYYVYRRSYSSDNWKFLKDVTSGSTTSYKHDSKGKYVYRIMAYTKVDGEKYFSNYSNEIVVRTMTSRNLRIFNVNSEFKNELSWKTTTTATSYQIYYKISKDGEWQLAETVPADTSGAERQIYYHEVRHGKSYYYKVRAIHEQDGTTTIGAFGDESRRQIISYEADLTTVMSTKTVKSASRTTITVTNNGPVAFTFYGDDAMWIDPDSKSNCRDVYLCDYDVYVNTGKLVKVDSVKVKSGKTVTLLVVVKGKNTRYDADTCIYMQGYYDGLNREAYISANSGAMVYRR